MPTPTLKHITAQETRPHRQEILRKGQPPETVIYAKDDNLETIHFAIAEGDEILSIASLEHEPFPLNGKSAWRMRGVATYPEARGRGYGAMLVQASIDHALSKGSKYIWCNARIAAIPFYTASGFTQHGEEFDIPGAGPHSMMYRKFPKNYSLSELNS